MTTEDSAIGVDRRKPRFQISLRSLFLLTVSLAVGLTIGVGPASNAEDDAFEIGIADLNWHYAFLGAASILIAIELLQEARVLRRARDIPRFTSAVEIFGRLALALILVASLTIRVLVDRRFIIPPANDGGLFYYGDPLTMHVWWLALGIALMSKLRSVQPPARSRRRPIITVATTLAAAAFGAYMLFELQTVTFLVHVACLGVDSTHAAADHRYRSLNDAEQMGLMFTSVGASIAALLASVCLVRGVRQLTGGTWTGRIPLAAGLLLLSGAALYCGWFFGRVFPSISPDLAGASYSGTWFQVLGGGVLATMAVVYTAYCLSRITRDQQPTLLRAAPVDLNSSVTILLLLVAAVIFFIQFIRDMLGYSSGIDEALAYSLIWPDTYFIVGIAVVSIQLAWSMWRRGRRNLTVYPIDGRRFAAALIAFTALAIVAIPTFLAASFAFWLGPWYRW